MTKLEKRTGLPDALRVLAETLPRDGWEHHPNFDGMTRFWLQRHMMFREVLSRLTSSSQLFLAKGVDTRRYAGETAQYAGFLLNELHGHHSIEDHHYFPLLQGLDARLEEGFRILDKDHHALDGHIHGLADTTNLFLQRIGETDERDRAGDLNTALTQFERFLNRHLLDEEDLVVPVILTYAPKLH